jgi:hypothetical protein
MADVRIPYNDGFGRASFEQMDTYLQNHLISGVSPPLEPAISFKQKASTTLALFTVVGLDTNGELVIANNSTIKPIGVLAHASTAGVSPAVNAQVWYSGCFDPTYLIWDASFDTDAKKAAAFRGSPTPTQIVIRKKFQ